MATAKQAPQASEIPAEEIVNVVVDPEASVTPARYFTIPGRDPFEEIEWEQRDAIIPGKSGPAFEQRSVEFPKFWSQTATNIVAQKYFRGRLTSPDRERRTSLRPRGRKWRPQERPRDPYRAQQPRRTSS